MRRFAADARTIVQRAEALARAEGSRSVESEHLLLALTLQKDTDPARLLAGVGLDHDRLREALNGQFRDALTAAGVELSDDEPPRRQTNASQRLRIGQSGKLALQRALAATAQRGDKRLETSHLLLGILRAEHGTVPRALAHAQIDQQQLIASAEAALATTSS
jgi:ATP-dependent Clp protease ATP-binding subunit ClpA